MGLPKISPGSFFGFFFLAALCLFFFGSSQEVFADTMVPGMGMATATIISDGGSSCAPNAASLAQISAIQNDPALSSLNEIRSELVVRQGLLKATIVCAESEATAMKTSLLAITPDSNFADLQSQLAGQLDQAVGYYQLELDKINDVGVSGTQSIAKDVLTWRESNYAPLAANVSNFILWSGNQTVFATAEQRLEEVGNLVGSVPFSNNTELQIDFQAATVSLQSAENENAQAKQALTQSLPSDESLELIQSSLNDLAATYQHFFDISNLAETLLPH